MNSAMEFDAESHPRADHVVPEDKTRSTRPMKFPAKRQANQAEPACCFSGQSGNLHIESGLP